MQPDKTTVFKLFDRQHRYLVPLFQRPYVWTREGQWEPLWEDIEEKANDVLNQQQTQQSGPHTARQTQIRTHFLGAVVFGTSQTYGSQLDASLIVDGQQRLTTLQVLLLALRDFASMANAEMARILAMQQAQPTQQAQRDTQMVHSRLTHITEQQYYTNMHYEKYKVWPTNRDQLVFEHVFSAGAPATLQQQYQLTRRPYSRRFNPRPPLVEAYFFFYNAIEDYVIGPPDPATGQRPTPIDWVPEAARLLALHDAITKYLEMVTIDLEAGDDPQVIFETLNATGVPLLPSDLIRNFVFLEAERQGGSPDAIYTTYWQGYETDFWKKKERQGRLERPRLDLFVFNYLTYKTGRDLRVTELFQEFRAWWSSQPQPHNIQNALMELEQFSLVFRTLIEPASTTRIDVFARRLRQFDTSTIFPLLLFLFGERQSSISSTDLEGIAIDLESYLVRRAVCGLTNKSYNRNFLAWLQQLRQVQLIDRAAVRSQLLASNAPAIRWPDDNEFESKWMEQPVYKSMGSGRVAMVLEALELKMRTAIQPGLQTTGQVTVEHVMPQAWRAQPSAWPYPPSVTSPGTLDEERRDRLIHTFGNLTLLTPQGNSYNSNNPFPQKQPLLVQQSGFLLNNYFQAYSSNAIWTEDDIQTRGRDLFRVAARLWPR